MENMEISLCGKTYPARLVQIKARTSESSSKSSAKLKTVTPLFLDLRKESGPTREKSWETGILSRGGSWTLNTGASPKDAEESSLWQILEGGVPEKYSLSERACEGILRRAERRGKELPNLLRLALELKTGELFACKETESTEQTPQDATDAAYTGDHENRITDYTAVLVQCIGNGQADQTDLSDIVGTLNCMHDQQSILCARERCGCEGGGKGCLIQDDISNTIATSNDQFLCVALDRAAYNQGQNAQFDIGVDDSGTAHTVVAKGPGAVCYAVDVRNNRIQDVNGTFQAKPNGGISNNMNNVVLVLYPVDIILRRLTPTECARLQGMPDWWCDDVPHSDSAEYKMWGNGMALPNVLYVMEGIRELLEG